MKFFLAGKIRSGDYHRAKALLHGFSALDNRIRFVILDGMDDTTYEEHVDERKRVIGISALSFRGPCMVYTDDKHLIGGVEDLLSWGAKRGLVVKESKTGVDYDAEAREAYRAWRESTGHLFRNMTFSVDGVVIGTIVIELYTDLCPRTSANFIALSGTEINQSYHRTPIHRVVRGGWVQGGDTEGGAGDGGKAYVAKDGRKEITVEGAKTSTGEPLKLALPVVEHGVFADECFAVKHDIPGIIGMANKGPHTNGSQWYICLKPTRHFDAKFVGFGRVIEGMGVLRKIEAEETLNDRPLKSVLVLSTGPEDFSIPHGQI